MWFVLFLPSAFASEIWLVYSKPDTRPATYLGYKNTTPPNSFDDVDSTEKPTINESLNQVHITVFMTDEEIDEKPYCTKTEKAYDEPSDAKIMPSTKEAQMSVERAIGKRRLNVSDLKPVQCDIAVQNKGGTQIDFKVQVKSDGNEIRKVEDNIQVHNLYRFRITAGPVFTTLRHRQKSFSTITNSAGQNVVSTSSLHDSPVDYVLFLKTYLALRDPLEDYSLTAWQRFSVNLGINLVHDPLQNLYLGIGYEIVKGVDIVAGAHWSKISRLTGGFAPGQITTASSLPTQDKFDNGWFIGTAVDTGVAAAWLKKAVKLSF